MEEDLLEVLVGRPWYLEVGTQFTPMAFWRFEPGNLWPREGCNTSNLSLRKVVDTLRFPSVHHRRDVTDYQDPSGCFGVAWRQIEE